MCGIAGVSFSPKSKLSRRKLAHALLDAAEVRGRDASGFAWVGPDGRGFFKKDVKGSQLSVARIPANAKSMILHTRASTHGDPKVNENNHPVVSPGGNILLVHNGIIWNHAEVREALGSIGAALPEVDSSVIGAVIETLGLESTDLLQGAAACAWFDTETDHAINLARFDSSPVSYAELLDGTVVFASTPEILARALNELGLKWIGFHPTSFRAMREGDYLQLIDGQIFEQADVEWGDYGYRSYNSTPAASKPGVETGHSHGRRAWDEDDDTPSQTNTLRGWSSVTGQSVVFGTPEATDDPDVPNELDDDWWNAVEDEGPPSRNEGPMGTAAFYTLSHDGDYVEYTNVFTMLSALSWHTKLSDNGVELVEKEDPRAWVNYFEDIGDLLGPWDQEDPANMENSWVRNPAAMEDITSAIPAWVREGVDFLRRVTV